jgi:hypothetical protein
MSKVKKPKKIKTEVKIASEPAPIIPTDPRKPKP